MTSRDRPGVDDSLTPAAKTRVIPFIFLTSKKDQMGRLKANRMGMDDYITKPFDLEHLHARVNALLERVAVYKGER